MPGGYGNIKSEDGKPFKAGNKMAEKWTLKDAEKLANDLIDWLEEQTEDENGNKRDKGNIFINEFIGTRRLPPRILNYLAKKFTAFVTLMEIAKNIQEAKLLKYGIADRLNASMTKFCLINHHGYTDKSNVDVTTQGEKVNDVKFTVADPATIEKVQRLIDGEGPGQ
jgi:hypothetical protein